MSGVGVNGSRSNPLCERGQKHKDPRKEGKRERERERSLLEMKVVVWLLTLALARCFRPCGAQKGPVSLCRHRCGRVPVPYPFGLAADCARSADFLLNCTTINGKNYLLLGNLTIKRLSVFASTISVLLPGAEDEAQLLIAQGNSTPILDISVDLPVITLGWRVPNLTCGEATLNSLRSACGPNAMCGELSSGYICQCDQGYRGNPYDHLWGCADINECEKVPNPCKGKCKNTPGGYICYCPFGKRGNASVGCQISPWIVLVPAIILVFSTTVGALVLHKWRRRRKEKNFKRNGGELLKHHRVQIFTETELAKATNSYDDSNKLGKGGFGSVYRGRIAGDTVVAIKKPNDVHKSLIKGNFLHELEIVMQINHKNVVKLHGICLETRIPLLVYEYISNGTLFQHIHQNASTILRSWKNRLRIATEAALALEYMHSCAEPPIIHGDIKSVNILLDHKYSVKVSDFGTSVLISPECNYVVANEIQGTLGYIDPEYLTTGMLTTKSDVYSFGVVLVELLTRKKPTSFITKSGESINIIHHFISSVKDKSLSDVINFNDTIEDEMERVGMVAEIAVKCLDQNGARRPTMREVAEQLTRINHEFDSSTVEEDNEEAEGEVLEESLYSHATSITSKMSQHGTTGSLF